MIDLTNNRRSWDNGLSWHRGSRHTMSKLTEESVLEIRSSDESDEVLSERYGVTASTIRVVKQKRTWKHVGDHE